jgi:hypothetical protein
MKRLIIRLGSLLLLISLSTFAQIKDLSFGFSVGKNNFQENFESGKNIAGEARYIFPNVGIGTNLRYQALPFLSVGLDYNYLLNQGSQFYNPGLVENSTTQSSLLGVHSRLFVDHFFWGKKKPFFHLFVGGGYYSGNVKHIYYQNPQGANYFTRYLEGSKAIANWKLETGVEIKLSPLASVEVAYTMYNNTESNLGGFPDGHIQKLDPVQFSTVSFGLNFELVNTNKYNGVKKWKENTEKSKLVYIGSKAHKAKSPIEKLKAPNKNLTFWEKVKDFLDDSSSAKGVSKKEYLANNTVKEKEINKPKVQQPKARKVYIQEKKETVYIAQAEKKKESVTAKPNTGMWHFKKSTPAKNNDIKKTEVVTSDSKSIKNRKNDSSKTQNTIVEEKTTKKSVKNTPLKKETKIVQNQPLVKKVVKKNLKTTEPIAKAKKVKAKNNPEFEDWEEEFIQETRAKVNNIPGPVEVSTKPSAPIIKPSTPIRKSNVSTPKPSVVEAKPVISSSKPSSPVTKLKVPESKPKVKITKPVISSSKPTKKISKPSEPVVPKMTVEVIHNGESDRPTIIKKEEKKERFVVSDKIESEMVNSKDVKLELSFEGSTKYLKEKDLKSIKKTILKLKNRKNYSFGIYGSDFSDLQKERINGLKRELVVKHGINPKQIFIGKKSYAENNNPSTLSLWVIKE